SPAGLPTDPYVPDSGIRLVKSRVRPRDGTPSGPPPRPAAGSAVTADGSGPRGAVHADAGGTARSSRAGPLGTGSGSTPAGCPSSRSSHSDHEASDSECDAAPAAGHGGVSGATGQSS